MQMIAMYFNSFISVLYLFSALFLNYCSSPTSSDSTGKNDILGTWTYSLTVCNENETRDAVFEIQIAKDYFVAHGNLLECNRCSKTCNINKDQIIFPDKHSTAICTELECSDFYKFCGNEKTLTYLFQDMKYTVNGNELTLEAYGKTLKLNRKI